MEQIFKDFSAWFWPILGNLFSSIGNFFGDIGISLYENYNTILPVLGYMFACAIILFLLLKLLQYAVQFFKKLTLKGLFSTLIKLLIAGVVFWLFASLIFYLWNFVKKSLI